MLIELKTVFITCFYIKEVLISTCFVSNKKHQLDFVEGSAIFSSELQDTTNLLKNL